MKQNYPPNLDILMSDLKKEIFTDLNCVQIGKITKVTGSENTVEVQLQIKHVLEDGTSLSVPVLVDCPYFVLSGGSAYIDMPIAVGDYCLVLFSDRDIDIWFDTANVADPNSTRKHSLSDGIALVGISPKTSVRDFDGNNMRLFGNEIHLNGDGKTFVTHAELDTALQTFITALNAHVHTSAPSGSPTSAPVSSMSIDISASETTTIKTGG